MAPSLRIPVEGDFSKFRKELDGAHDQVRSSVKGIEGAFKNLNPDAGGIWDKFKSVSESGAKDAGNHIGLLIAAGLTAAFAGVATGLLVTIKDLAKFGDLAEELRLPVNLLQALNVAAIEARVPAETMTKAYEKFTEVSKEGGDETSKFEKALGNVGDSFVKAFKDAGTQAERLRILADAMKSTDDEVKRAQLSLQAFGTENTRFISVIAGGRDGIEQFIDRMRQLGLTVDETLVRQAQKAKSEIGLLSEVLSNRMAPALADVYRAILPLLGPLENLAFLVSQTIGLLQSNDELKPTSALEAELDTISKKVERFQALQAELSSGAKSGTTTLRDMLREFIDKEFGTKLSSSVEDELKQLDAEIAKVLERKAVIDGLLASRKGGASAGTEPPAFKPRPSLEDDKRDRFDAAADAIEKRTARTVAETAAINLGTEAREKARITAELETVAKQLNGEVTEEHRLKIEKLAEAYGKAAAAIENARSPLATFARESANVGKQLNEFGARSLDSVTNELASVVTSTKTASEAFKAMATSIINDLARIAIRQSITGPIASALFGAFGDTALNVGGGGVGKNAGGTNFWGGGATWVGEQGPEILNLPRGSQIIPNNVAERMGGGGGGGIKIIVNNNAGADVQTGTNDAGDIEIMVNAAVDRRLASGKADSILGARYGTQPRIRQRG